jgi:hypothetical protein
MTPAKTENGTKTHQHQIRQAVFLQNPAEVMIVKPFSV